MKNNIFLTAVFGLAVFGLQGMSNKEENESNKPSYFMRLGTWAKANLFTLKGEKIERVVRGSYVDRDGKVYEMTPTTIEVRERKENCKKNDDKQESSTTKNDSKKGEKAQLTTLKVENTVNGILKPIGKELSEEKTVKLFKGKDSKISVVPAGEFKFDDSNKLTVAQRYALVLTGAAIAGTALYVYREPISKKAKSVAEAIGDAAARVVYQVGCVLGRIFPPVPASSTK